MLSPVVSGGFPSSVGFDDLTLQMTPSQLLLDAPDKEVARRLNQTDERGQTPLHLACQRGNADVARYLISTCESAQCPL